MLQRTTLLAVCAAALVLAACDKPSDAGGPTAEAGPVATAAAVAPAPAPRAPEIIVDHANVSVGSDRVSTGEPALAQMVGVFVKGRPMIEGQAVDLVAMRNAKPSHVVAVLAALRAANASGANVKTEARDNTTQKLPVSFAASVPDCTIVAFIAKDAAIDIWPAGGGRAKRIVRGLAGPDVTLGTDAIREMWGTCGAPVIAVGAEDTMTWGLVFDLATNALQAPGSRANAAVLLRTAVPGRKLVMP
jgi:hypothetical protein